jgi:hypothetical protein
MIAMPTAERPLMNDTVKASRPRVRQPKTSTGVNAIAKKVRGAARGITM